MAEIKSDNITCNTCDIHFLRAGKPEDTAVVLLHGMKFQASTWHDLGTLDIVSKEGFQAIAIDMPGFGQSQACSAEQDSVLEAFLLGLGFDKVILVGPSMGGRISLEFTIKHPNLIKGLVLIGSVGVEENREKLSSVTVPTLLVWGSEDQISPLKNCDLLLSSIPGAKKIIIEGAPHPCYLDNPDIWHTELIGFINSLTI